MSLSYRVSFLRQIQVATRFCNENRNLASPRAGLTLLELVVVLGILALLSTVAVRSLEPMADQARYEVTQRVFNDLRIATSGDSSRKNLNGQDIVSGFIADTGSLPSSLDELLTIPVGVSAHAVQAFDSDRDSTTDVTLSSGWKGPYMQLGAGVDEVLDGWGRIPTINSIVGGFEFSSQGSDGDSLAPEDDYRADVTVTVRSKEYAGDIVFRLFAIDSQTGSRIDPAPTGTEKLCVLFYGVNASGGTSGAIEEQTLIIPNTGSFELRRSDTFHGTVAARAVHWNDLNSDDLLNIGETVLKKSYVHYAVVNSGHDVRLEMELR